jgi:predicted RNA-binding Zn-ribbon protein involved in translation (DUF1610 family)
MSVLDIEVNWEVEGGDEIIEPYMILFGEYRFNLSQNKSITQELIKYKKKDIIPELSTLEIKETRSMKCDSCGVNSDGLLFTKSESSTFICPECLNKMINSLRDLNENIYVTYRDGLFIKRISGVDTNLPDRFEKDDIVIAIGNGRRDKIIPEDRLFVFYKSNNFDSLKDDINNLRNWDGEFLRDCSSCGKNIIKDEGYTLDRTREKGVQIFHENCLLDIIDRILEFEKEEKEEILARSL